MGAIQLRSWVLEAPSCFNPEESNNGLARVEQWLKSNRFERMYDSDIEAESGWLTVIDHLMGFNPSGEVFQRFTKAQQLTTMRQTLYSIFISFMQKLVRFEEIDEHILTRVGIKVYVTGGLCAGDPPTEALPYFEVVDWSGMWDAFVGVKKPEQWGSPEPQ